MTSFDFWAIALACLCNVTCAVLGCYLLLRRLSLLGDAIAHAVLPGIVLAYLLTGKVSGLPIVLGAMALGFLTALLTQTLAASGKVAEDSSMGIVFTALFAVGVLLVSRNAGKADLDVDCVLSGNILYAAGNTCDFLGLEVPEALGRMSLVLLLALGFVLLLWKELKLAAFDPALATAMGFHAAIIHYLLMALVGGVTVAAFEVVGSLLVVAMLIVPAATAHLLTDRLAPMLAWSALLGALASIAGYLSADRLNTAPGAMMAVSSGGLLFLAVLFAPRHGVLSRLSRTAQLRLRIATEDLLASLYRREEAGSPPPSDTPWLPRRILLLRKQIEPGPIGLTLTDVGRKRAIALVRAHRLWETYLAENLALPADHLHEAAHRVEHFLDPTLQDELAREVKHSDVDPHGRTIPKIP